ncbi:hypothetical protein PR048_015010 [Dryococelus australis]|uniref:Transposase n=1 Tax=Dryococelus australis TaxID=614101 RepID=A0ABQ9HFQ7_9NEOP|nr:hypothetical protein PR048_015010 [Dryococelus australis]
MLRQPYVADTECILIMLHEGIKWDSNTTTVSHNQVGAHTHLTFMFTFCILLTFLICRYLSTGSTFYSLQNKFNIARNTIWVIVREICQTIWTHFKDIEMPEPAGVMWLDI